MIMEVVSKERAAERFTKGLMNVVDLMLMAESKEC